MSAAWSMFLVRVDPCREGVGAAAVVDLVGDGRPLPSEVSEETPGRPLASMPE